MRRTTKPVTNGRKGKIQVSDRTRRLVDRIRQRREQIQQRVGVLPNSAELIRQDRER
jgi:hypothetical protein